MEILQLQAWQALEFDLLSTAEFTCERWIAMDPLNDDSHHAYALTLYRQGRYKASYAAAIDRQHIGCLYVFALACLKLKKYTEGISALSHSKPLWSTTPAEQPPIGISERDGGKQTHLPTTAIMLTTLANLQNAQGNRKAAVVGYAQAAQREPFLWEAVDSLCQMGVKVKTKNLFDPYLKEATSSNITGGVSDISSFAVPSSFLPNAATSTPFQSSRMTSTPASTSLTPSTTAAGTTSPEDPFTLQSSSPLSFSTNNTNTTNRDVSNTPRERRMPGSFLLPPHAPQKRLLPRQKRAGLKVPMRALATSTSFDNSSTPISNNNSDPTTVTPSANKRLDAGNSGVALGGSRPAARHPHLEQLNSIIKVYRRLIHANLLIARYDCESAIAFLTALEQQQTNTPWVLAKLGRAYFEIVDYENSEKAFRELRQRDKFRTDDMEYYSTLLWHLRKERELGFLSYELLDIDRQSPQAWCALGNCMSLQKETEKAIECFERAIFLAPDEPYAYTLMAHEHVASESYGKAQLGFREAISKDHRHYNAWYGIGMVFSRQGDIENATLHFKHAHSINPNNAILLCCLGMMAEEQELWEDAFKYYRQACKVQPKSALSQFKLVRMLLAQQRYDDALHHFEILKRLAPNEAMVHFVLGRLHSELGNRTAAIQCYTAALQLDPRGSHLVRDELEKLADDDKDER